MGDVSDIDDIGDIGVIGVVLVLLVLVHLYMGEPTMRSSAPSPLRSQAATAEPKPSPI